MIDDEFYKGTVWEVGLKRFAPNVAVAPLEIKILPLLKAEPIYFPNGAWPNFGRAEALGDIHRIDVVPEYEVSLQVQ